MRTSLQTSSGPLLTELRVRAGLSVNALADLAGVHWRAVRDAEAGRVPTPAAQVRIAAALDADQLELWPLEAA